VRVAVDTQLAVGTATGIGEYVRGLVAAVRERGLDVEELCDPHLDPWRFDRRVFWDQVLLPQRARQSDADVLHCASGTAPLTVPMPVVITVHDVAWLRVQSHARPYARYYFGRFSLDRYRQAAAIVVDSEFSRRELLEVADDLDPGRVHVVYPGVASDFCTLERGDGDGRTVLVPGTVERRKNLEAVIKAMPFLEGARLVSVGPYTKYQDECEALARELEVSNRVEFRGYIAREELLELYATCAVVAIPSVYEGFGYGAAQALCAGTPLVAADRASLPEVVGTAAPSVSLDDGVQPWVESLQSALRGDYNTLAATSRPPAIKRFAWPASAATIQQVYESTLTIA
jgi:glycosyltransferase involved in cell wall biosynthesis